MATPKYDAPRGLIAGPDEEQIVLRRYHPASDLQPFVEHYWLVRWDRGARPPVRQAVLPHPCVHMVVEQDRGEVVGVVEGRFERVVEGRGRVLGIKLRPGAFSGVWDRPISELTGQRCPMTQMFGAAAKQYIEAVGHTDDDARLTEHAEVFLRRLRPALSPAAVQARDLVEQIASDPGLSTVDRVAAHAGLGPRSLQRLFARCVGVGPKWVILRYRLHEALARLDRGDVEWASLAAELGYFDQAHFIRHFKAFVGSTPLEYVQRQRHGSPPEDVAPSERRRSS